MQAQMYCPRWLGYKVFSPFFLVVGSLEKLSKIDPHHRLEIVSLMVHLVCAIIKMNTVLPPWRCRRLSLWLIRLSEGGWLVRSIWSIIKVIILSPPWWCRRLSDGGWFVSTWTRWSVGWFVSTWTRWSVGWFISTWTRRSVGRFISTWTRWSVGRFISTWTRWSVWRFISTWTRWSVGCSRILTFLHKQIHLFFQRSKALGKDAVWISLWCRSHL